MSGYEPITLSKWERYVFAPIWAHLRWMEAYKRGLKEGHGCPEEEGLGAHLWGVLGEMAYAKARGVYFEPTINTFRLPDVAGVQVRCRTGHHNELIVRESDRDEDFFALVTVAREAPHVFRVYDCGIYGGEAKKHMEWFKEPTGKPGRPHAWFVPQSALVVPDPLRDNARLAARR